MPADTMPDPTPPDLDAALAAVETLAREFHTVYQKEARRQGDVRHYDDYDKLSEDVKDFDRALARHVLRALAAQPERALEPPDAGLVAVARQVAAGNLPRPSTVLYRDLARYILRAAG